MRNLTPLVEPVSIDEAFLDLSGTERLHGRSAAQSLARFAAEVEREIGITVSIGLSYNKFLAKIASDLDKPRGFAVLGRADAPDFLAAKPVSIIFGVGRVAQERLARDGYRMIADLQKADERDLMRLYGVEGQRLSRLARGIDHRKVVPDRDAKSVSAETTFDTDIGALRPLEKILWELSEKVSARLKANAISGSTVTLKLKTADFQIRTRARSLGDPTQLARRIFDCGRELLARETDGTKFRLIGIGVSGLQSSASRRPGRSARSECQQDRFQRIRARYLAGEIRPQGSDPRYRLARRRRHLTRLRPLLAGLGGTNFELRHLARDDEVVVIERQRARDAVLVQFETDRIDRSLLARLVRLVVVSFEIADADRPAAHVQQHIVLGGGVVRLLRLRVDRLRRSR